MAFCSQPILSWWFPPVNHKTLFFRPGVCHNAASGFQDIAERVAQEYPVFNNRLMGKKRGNRSDDRHKPARMVRLKASLAAQLEAIAEENATNLTQEVNRAVRELLVREGRWPPKPSP